MITADPSTWHLLEGETIYFEPCEEAEVFRGSCIMMGHAINFHKITGRSFDMELGDRCYVLSHHEPTIEKFCSNICVVHLQYTSIFERTHASYKDTRI